VAVCVLPGTELSFTSEIKTGKAPPDQMLWPIIMARPRARPNTSTKKTSSLKPCAMSSSLYVYMGGTLILGLYLTLAGFSA
jgi:hypothetical protein